MIKVNIKKLNHRFPQINKINYFFFSSSFQLKNKNIFNTIINIINLILIAKIYNYTFQKKLNE